MCRRRHTSTVRQLKNLCRDDKGALDATDQATQHEAHRPTTVNNINTSSMEERPQGNSSARALRKLRKDRPDLHERARSQRRTMLVRVSEISDILGSRPRAHSSRNAPGPHRRGAYGRGHKGDSSNTSTSAAYIAATATHTRADNVRSGQYSATYIAAPRTRTIVYIVIVCLGAVHPT